jgi:hypothetical protein
MFWPASRSIYLFELTFQAELFADPETFGIICEAVISFADCPIG